MRLNFLKNKGCWWHGRNRECANLETAARLISAGQTVIEIGGHIGELIPVLFFEIFHNVESIFEFFVSCYYVSFTEEKKYKTNIYEGTLNYFWISKERISAFMDMEVAVA